jgi:AcrR family transcriptional regulator
VTFPRRAEAARRTRLALIRAAAELFIERGYAGTTVDAVAARAQVARATVFTAVPGGKPALLKAARDIALAGDDEPVPVPQRPWFLAAMAPRDPAEVLRRQCANYRMLHQRAAQLEAVLATAAASDPALHVLHAEAHRQRQRGCALVVHRLQALGGLAAGLTDDKATDTLYALSSPAVHLILVHDRGWSPAQYERWLYEQLRTALLAAPQRRQHKA